jgi:hypothetical protein
MLCSFNRKALIASIDILSAVSISITKLCDESESATRQTLDLSKILQSVLTLNDQSNYIYSEEFEEEKSKNEEEERNIDNNLVLARKTLEKREKVIYTYMYMLYIKFPITY